MTQPTQPAHNARACRLCAPLRHPSNHRTRRVLASLPRQSHTDPAIPGNENGGNH